MISSTYILSLGISLDRILSLDCPTEWCAALFGNRASGVGPQRGPLILNEILPCQPIGGAKLSHNPRIKVRGGQTHARAFFGDNNLPSGGVDFVHDLREYGFKLLDGVSPINHPLHGLFNPLVNHAAIVGISNQLCSERLPHEHSSRQGVLTWDGLDHGDVRSRRFSWLLLSLADVGSGRIPRILLGHPRVMPPTTRGGRCLPLVV